MKFHIDPPPISEETQNNTAQLVLANLGYDDFNRDVRAQLEERSKQ